MAGKRVLRDILAKPAGPDCNMACTYCFYSSTCSLFGEGKIHRMSEAVLEEMIRQVMSQSGHEVSIGWQGGEPTLMGRDFFEKAVKLETRFGRGKVVGNGLQTNGIVVDRAWARFFKEFSFLIGLSIDGPEHVHDHYRRTKRGRGSWSRVTDSARLMLDEGVSVNALTVVNDYSVRFPQEIYESHKGLGLTYMQFIPCVEMDPERPGTIAPFSVSARRVRGVSLQALRFVAVRFRRRRPDHLDQILRVTAVQLRRISGARVHAGGRVRPLRRGGA